MLYVITYGPIKIMKINTTISIIDGAPQMIEKSQSKQTTDVKKKTNMEIPFRYLSFVQQQENEIAYDHIGILHKTANIISGLLTIKYNRKQIKTRY